MKQNAIAFFVGIIIATCVMYFAWRQEEKAYETILDEKNDSLRYERNDKGQLIASKLASEATVKQLADAYPEVVKQLKEDFDIKMREMRAYVKNQIVAQGSGKSTIINNYHTDSTGTKIEYRDINFDDGYLKFKTSLFEGLDFGESTYTYTDTITTVFHRKKKWVFGKESLYSSTSLKNPNAKIVGTTNLLVNQRDKRFVIYGGVGYDPFLNKPTINVGIGYAIIKF